MRQRHEMRGVLCALLLAGGVALPLEAVAQPVSNSSYCSKDGTNLIFAIDITTAYDAKDKELLVRAVGDIFDSLRGGERLLIRTITDTFSTSDRMIERCIPQCVANGPLDSLWRCNQGIIVSETRKAKQEIVEALRVRLASVKPRPRSDIARTLAAVSREDAQHGGQTLLYVFSDMIENSDHVPGRDFLTLDNKRLIAHMKKFNLVASLPGADVRVFGVGRDGTEKRGPLPVGSLQKLLEFWRIYFTAGGAKSVEISQNMVVH